MESNIEKLYYGEICPCKNPSPSTDRFRDNRQTISRTEEQLLERFPECKELLTAYTDALRIEAQLECEADFACGFRIGSALTFDILNT